MSVSTSLTILTIPMIVASGNDVWYCDITAKYSPETEAITAEKPFPDVEKFTLVNPNNPAEYGRRSLLGTLEMVRR